ncbi:hypothetical protein HanXRQr2_Chr02g0058371 [Helianthus annuus]|uniref:Uncharacterized protein n=1 Tax=Helianthus annuus TaxID=4232 RepID=A0A251VES5_HELAN|nr:hypothetical protein HanXRQr2_Chr02g0058371 [Helianthus annuus]
MVILMIGFVMKCSSLASSGWNCKLIRATVMCITCTYTLKSGLRLTLLNLFFLLVPLSNRSTKTPFFIERCLSESLFGRRLKVC